MSGALEPLPYYRERPQKLRADRKVQRMTLEEEGAFHRLRHEQWLEGPLPPDIPSLADICNCDIATMQRIWPRVGACFQETTDGRLINGFIEDQRTELDAQRIKCAEAGRLGGLRKQPLASAKQPLADAKQPLADAKQATYRNRSSKEEEKDEDKDLLALTSLEVRADTFERLPLNDGTDFEITSTHLTEWSNLYPAVDIKQEIRGMRGWLLANPKKRKTRTGVQAFANSWLAKQQNQSGATRGNYGADHNAVSPARRRQADVDDSIRQASGIIGAMLDLNESDQGLLPEPGSSTGNSHSSSPTLGGYR